MPPKPPLSIEDRSRLKHMLKAARNAIDFAGERDAPALSADELRSAAVVNCFTVIGEAAAHPTPAARELAADIPWKQVVGMRHNIVHVYWGIDFREIVDTIRNDLPTFIAAIEEVLAENPAV